MTPELTPGLKLRALADAAPADAPVALCIFAAGKERRAAFRAEILQALVAAFGRLHVDFRRIARKANVIARGAHRHAVGRAGKLLTIRAVADMHPLRIDFRFIGDEAAIALPVYLHD